MAYMVEESDAGVDLNDLLGHPRDVIQIDRTGDLSLARVSLYASCSCRHVAEFV